MPLQSHTLLVTYGTSLFQRFSLMDPFHMNIQIGFHICFVITMLAAECLASLFMGSFKCVFKWSAREYVLSHWLHLNDFCVLCVIKCILKLFAYEEAKSYRLHLFDFTPPCLFKCVFKWSAREYVLSHWLHLNDFCLLCVIRRILKLFAYEEA